MNLTLRKKHTLALAAPFVWMALSTFFVSSQTHAPHEARGNSTLVAAVGQTPIERNSTEKLWAELMEGNRRFVSGKTNRPDLVLLRHALAKGQHPNVIVLACADSRVAPELLFDQTLGDLFVVRAAGNVADPIELGSIEYAVEHLGSTLLVVLGHEKCGAVTAACSGAKMPTSNLQAIVDKIDPAVSHAKHYANPDGLLDAAILENVHQSAREVIANSEALRHAHEDGKLAIIEAVYRLDAGEVVRLPNSVDAH